MYAAENALTPLEREIVDDIGLEPLRKMEAQKRAVDAYQKLYNYYAVNGIAAFPDDYAGEAIIDNTLHIYLTDVSKETLMKYAEILSGYGDVVTFEKRAHSYKELLSLQTAVTAPESGVSINLCYVDVKNNRVVAEVSNIETATIQARGNGGYFPEDAPIAFVEGGPVNTTSDAYGGFEMYLNGAYNRPIAACGYYNGQPAILTCGHNGRAVIPVNTTLANSGGTTVATIAVSRFHDGLPGDYAIGYLNTWAYTPTNKVIDVDGSLTEYAGTYSSVPVGTILTKYGPIGGFATYEVHANNSTINYGTNEDPQLHYGLTTCIAIHGEVGLGDSGGPIMHMATNAAYFVGVQSGRRFEMNGEQEVRIGIFSPYSMVDNIFTIDTDSESN